MPVVAHFTRQFLNLTETFIRNQIDNHIKYRPIIICKERINTSSHIKYIEEKYPLLSLEKNKLIPDFKYKFLRKISNIDEREIFNYIKQNKPSILHFHYGTDAGMYHNVIKKSNIPSVVSFYGYDYSNFPKQYFGYGKYYLQNKVFSTASKILAMSPEMKQNLIDIGCPEDKIIVHYYGTDIKKFLFPKRIFLHKNKINLLILAGLVPKKGHINLFAAIKSLVNEDVINFNLKIAGSGILESKLRKYVNDNNLNKFIQFGGSIPYGSKQMINEYKNADIFIHPSVTAPDGDKEGIPGTIIEAMASGLPVISTFHAGIPSIIEHKKTGWLVPEYNVNELTIALKYLINNIDLRKDLGKNASNYAINHLDLKIKEQNLENIYNDLI